MKRIMKRFMAKLTGKPTHKTHTLKIDGCNTVYVDPDHKFRFRHTNDLRSRDLRCVSGQARIGARYFRKLEANQVHNGRRKLYPCK